MQFVKTACWALFKPRTLRPWKWQNLCLMMYNYGPTQQIHISACMLEMLFIYVHKARRTDRERLITAEYKDHRRMFFFAKKIKISRTKLKSMPTLITACCLISTFKTFKVASYSHIQIPDFNNFLSVVIFIEAIGSFIENLLHLLCGQFYPIVITFLLEKKFNSF